MKITFIAFGTRGDVQPAIALGKALAARGHQVRVVASGHFAEWIAGHGLEAAAASVDTQAMMESEGGRAWVESGSNPMAQMKLMRQLLLRYGWDMMNDAWNACRDAEVVVSSFTSDTYAVSIAEKLDAQHISMPLQPALIATRSGATTMNGPLPNRDSIINYWFGRLFLEPMRWRLFGDQVTRFRHEVLQLPPQTYAANHAAMQRMLVLNAYSAHVAPHPRDWPANIHTTGYWFLDESRDWQPPDELLRFLAAGEPPLCVGFGSMVGRDAEAMTQMVTAAVAQSGCRALLLSGWAGLGDETLPPTMFRLNAAPHEWLFPRVAAVLHHGGAGTTGAGLRAGVPSILVPHLGDQLFWGKRVEILGVGPKAIPRDKLSVAALANAMRVATSDPAMKQRAAALGARIAAEDGIGTAVKLIEQFLY